MPRTYYEQVNDQNGDTWYVVCRSRQKRREFDDAEEYDRLQRLREDDTRRTPDPYEHNAQMHEPYRVHCCNKLGIHPHNINPNTGVDPRTLDFPNPYPHQNWQPEVHVTVRSREGDRVPVNPRRAMRQQANRRMLKVEREAEEGLLKLESVGKAVGHKIERERNRHGMIQEELAQELNVPVKVISEMEKGTAQYDRYAWLIRKMNQLFGTDLLKDQSGD